MGQPQSKITKAQWELISQQNQNYLIVRDKSGRQGQQYEVFIHPQTIISQELTIYNLRNTPPHQVITVYSSEVKDQLGLCSNNNSFRVITEHICIRFSQNFQLTVQQLVYVLMQVVKGYAYLYSLVGCFHITQNMIGFTAQGEVKVWMHENYGQNRPQFTKKSIACLNISKYQSINQQQVFMITQIFSIIAKHTNKIVFDKYLAGYRLEKYSFKNIKNLFQDLKLKYQIQPLKRIDMMKKKLIFRV